MVPLCKPTKELRITQSLILNLAALLQILDHGKMCSCSWGESSKQYLTAFGGIGGPSPPSRINRYKVFTESCSTLSRKYGIPIRIYDRNVPVRPRWEVRELHPPNEIPKPLPLYTTIFTCLWKMEICETTWAQIAALAGVSIFILTLTCYDKTGNIYADGSSPWTPRYANRSA